MERNTFGHNERSLLIDKIKIDTTATTFDLRAPKPGLRAPILGRIILSSVATLVSAAPTILAAGWRWLLFPAVLYFGYLTLRAANLAARSTSIQLIRGSPGTLRESDLFSAKTINLGRSTVLHVQSIQDVEGGYEIAPLHELRVETSSGEIAVLTGYPVEVLEAVRSAWKGWTDGSAARTRP